MAKLVINGLEDLEVKAGEFASLIGENRVIAFYGSMGAGKTTFITALCRHYGVEDVVNSPTFTIVNEYELKADLKSSIFNTYNSLFLASWYTS